MVAILIVSAIPCGLAGTVTSFSGLYTIRFFIGMRPLLPSFCKQLTSLFHQVSRAELSHLAKRGRLVSPTRKSLVLQTCLSDAGVNGWRSNLRRHDCPLRPTPQGWTQLPPRMVGSVCYCPVPILIGTAILTLVFGTDHPAGKWSERHNICCRRLCSCYREGLDYRPRVTLFKYLK